MPASDLAACCAKGGGGGGGGAHRDAGGAAGAEALQLWPARRSQGSGCRRFLGVPWRLALVCRKPNTPVLSAAA